MRYVADLVCDCADEHVELLLEYTPILCICSLAPAPGGTHGLYVLIKGMREQSVPGSFSPLPLRAWVRGYTQDRVTIIFG